jgi:hypothetical protein
MKKAILAFAIVSVSFVACNNDDKTETKTDSSTLVAPKVDTPVVAPKVDTATAPKMDSTAPKMEKK